MQSENKIGHYILGQLIGMGGFAKVRTAKHDVTNIQVAVKIINKKKMKNINMISKVKRQIKLLKNLNHPNIIKLYEVLDTSSNIFVIMELASNGALSQCIQNKINEEQARFFFRQTINGIEYIHKKLISHRDLKLQNILLDSNNIVKIGDFGLSNFMKDGKLLKTYCGSPCYAAPQIISGTKYEGTSIDIWSSGVILYTLIVGDQPFGTDNNNNITLLHKKIQHGIYQIPDTVSPYARDLISRMLQVDPRKRINIPDIKSHPWMRNEVPIYMKLTTQLIIYKDDEPQIDQQILNQIKGLNLNFNGYTAQKVQKVILKRDDVSFSIAYQLLKSEKQKKLYSENKLFAEEGHTILKNIKNETLAQFPPPIDPTHQKFDYGKYYEKNPRFLAQKILYVLKTLEVESQIKNQQYCIKCIYMTIDFKNSQSQMKDINQQLQRNIKKQDKFTKVFLRFTIQLYEIDRQTQMHLVNVHLTQGHPHMFFSLLRKFYKELQVALK